MQIVHITENPIAGAPYNLHRALIDYGGIKSRHICAHKNNGARVFGSDLIIGPNSKEEIFEAIKSADIVHMHNFYKEQTLFRTFPELWDIVMSKPRVWQAHTQRDCKWVSFEPPLADKTMKHLVIAQYHVRQYPECIVVPNIIDIWSRPLMPRWENVNDIPHVVYSPSNTNLKNWDDKGYNETSPVLRRLDSRGLISQDLIVDTPHFDCLFRKSVGDIGIDEIKTGSYHLCSLENLSLGLVNIANLDQLTQDAIYQVTGASSLPWVIATPGLLEHEILKLIKNRDELLKLRKSSRAWMEENWDPKKQVQRFIDVYKSM